MASLYQIENELQLIINEIEENGGELTEELAEKLEITKENLAEKVESYCQVISMYKSDIDCCKEEKDRINNIQKVKVSTIDRLKERLLEAVLKFGNDGKSGNKTFDLPTRKLFTRSAESINEDEYRINKLHYYFIFYLSELSRNNVLELGVSTDVNIILDAINTLAKADYETPYEFGNTPVEEWIPYTIADLQCLKFEIVDSVSLYNLLVGRPSLGYLVASNELIPQSSSIDKSIAKAIIKDDDGRVTIGTLVKKDSLTIK